MSRLITYSFVWNVSQFITAPILAVHRHVDEIHVFDGAYQALKDNGYAEVPWSTDGTREILQALKLDCPLTWHSCKKFWRDETAKKTYMLKFWKEGEWMYRLSDDEIPMGDIEAMFNRVRAETEALCGLVPMVEVQPGPRLVSLGLKPRFFKWQRGLHWGDKHYKLYNAEGVPREKWPTIRLKKMCLVHLKHLRIPRRLQAQLDYEQLDL